MNSVQRAGDNMVRWGKALTWAITVPVVGFLLFGLVGLAVGLVLALLVLGGTASSNKR